MGLLGEKQAGHPMLLEWGVWLWPAGYHEVQREGHESYCYRAERGLRGHSYGF